MFSVRARSSVRDGEEEMRKLRTFALLRWLDRRLSNNLYRHGRYLTTAHRSSSPD